MLTLVFWVAKLRPPGFNESTQKNGLTRPKVFYPIDYTASNQWSQCKILALISDSFRGSAGPQVTRPPERTQTTPGWYTPVEEDREMRMEGQLSTPDVKGWANRVKTRIYRRAFHRMGRSTKTEAARAIARQINAKKSAVNKSIRVKTRISRTEGLLELLFTKWSLRVSDFKGFYQTDKGVSVKIKHRRRLLKQHWVDHRRHVYHRRGDERFPIQQTYTTGPAAVATNVGFIDRLERNAQTSFEKEVAASMKFESLLAMKVVSGSR